MCGPWESVVMGEKFYIVHKRNGRGAKLRKVEAASLDDMATKMRQIWNEYVRVNVFGIRTTDDGMSVYMLSGDGIVETA
jgi:hypothetical protein